MTYLGNTPTTQNFISGTDYFNGTGSQTAFTLSRTVASVNDIQAVVNNVVQVPNDAYTISGTTITFTSAPSAGTQNVYVRYLSTTTQAITPSQNTVSWNTLDSNIQQDLGVMFKNRIINGNMVIDQRNAGAAVTASGSFAVDRFTTINTTDGAFSAQQDSSAPNGFNKSLKLTVTTADSSLTTTQLLCHIQRIEGFNIADLGWGTANAKTVTLSFWANSSVTGTFGGSLRNATPNRAYAFSYTINTANTWEYKTVTIVGDTTGTWATDNSSGIQVGFCLGGGPSRLTTAGSWGSDANILGPTGQTNLTATLNATFYITGVQLEVGTQATAFSTAGGSYGAELALCQRYFYLHASGANVEIGTGYQYNANTASVSVHFKVPMRTTPTLYSSSGTNYFITYGNGAGSYSTAVTLNAASSNNVALVNVTNSLTAGSGIDMRSDAAGAYVGFTAEL